VSAVLELRIYEDQRQVFTTECEGPLELGRQSEGEEGPYAQLPTAAGRRLVIARLDESSISRQHALLEPLEAGRVRLTNLSRKLSIRLPEGGELRSGVACELNCPVRLLLGSRTISLRRLDDEGMDIQGLAEATRMPGPLSGPSTRFPTLPLAATGGLDTEALFRWLQATMDVLHSAAGSFDFFQKASQAIVDLGGLDSGRVLLLQGDEWKVQAVHTGADCRNDADWQPSRKLLQRVRQEKRTFWQEPGRGSIQAKSLIGVQTVVVAPVLNRQGEVIGALYGDRRKFNPQTLSPEFTKLQALLLELLAMGVAAGLARLEHEQAAIRARIQFEQFFSPELARHLAVQPDLLVGRDTEVSILFCDIRAFSRISERLGPAGTVDWIRDVMEALSQCVRTHSGVLVDYIGDELIAMWGAPAPQADHARLACRAALDMLGTLATLNQRWQPILKETMGLGIGINSGVARVGNIGSRHKFKYGPLGNTVNLASRVEGATKHLKVPLLVTETTHAQLDAEFESRRLGQVRVVNIAEPVTLYQLAPPGHPNWPMLKQGYEKALEEFERQEFPRAARIIGNLNIEYPGDGPSLILLSRIVNYMIHEPATFDPVWEVPGK
jgi:adenylate cyclase